MYLPSKEKALNLHTSTENMHLHLLFNSDKVIKHLLGKKGKKKARKKKIQIPFAWHFASDILFPAYSTDVPIKIFIPSGC